MSDKTAAAGQEMLVFRKAYRHNVRYIAASRQEKQRFRAVFPLFAAIKAVEKLGISDRITDMSVILSDSIGITPIWHRYVS